MIWAFGSNRDPSSAEIHRLLLRVGADHHAAEGASPNNHRSERLLGMQKLIRRLP
jgi:hypothetical protein